MEKEKKSEIGSEKKVDRINKLIRKWQDYAGDALNRSLHVRRLVYDTEYAKDQMGSFGGSDDSIKSVINMTRSAENRIKTDFRDFHPYYELKPAHKNHNHMERVQIQDALNDKMSCNMNELWGAFDDNLDLSFSAVKVDVKYDSNGTPDLHVERMHDVTMVYGDCSVSIDKLFTNGNFVGLIRKVDYESNNHLFEGLDASKNYSDDIVLIEHFEKVVKKSERMGIRFDPETGKMVTEKAWSWKKGEDGKRIKGPTYVRTFEKPEMKMKVTRIANDVLQSEEYLDLENFPLVIGPGLFIDNRDANDKDRLTLIPYADAVVDAQQSLNMAASLNMKYMMQSRGSSKFMYAAEVVKGYEDEYRGRNTSSSDIPYNYTQGPNGEKIDIPPKPVPDIAPSPVVSEALNNYPALIQQILGVNLEQDTLFNASGEAIKQMQMVRHKSAKLYMDAYLQFMRNVGAVVKELFLTYFTGPMTVYANSMGVSQPIQLNEPLGGGRVGNDISAIKDKYNFDVKIGPSPAQSREKTQQSLLMMYQAMGPQMGQQIALQTSELYASSLDTPNRDLIVASVSQVKQQAQQSQYQAQEQAKKQQEQQLGIQKQMLIEKEQEMRVKNEKHAAELAEVHARLAKAQADLVKVHADTQISKDKLLLEERRAEAEERTAEINAGVEMAKIMKESNYG